MSAVRQALILVLMVHLVVAAELTCPSGTVRLDGVDGQWWCVRQYSNTMNFCTAVKTCHAKGEEMISKPVFDAMKSNSAFPGKPIWWVGLVDAANERGHNKSGWVWMKDGQVTTGTDSYFEAKEPNDQTRQDCMTISNDAKELRDEGCLDNHPFYCYSDPSAKVPPPKASKFEKVEIRERHQLDPGCWIRMSSASTLVNCTLACFAFEFDDCVGFYWNQERQDCVILPYFDATLPLSSAEMSATYMEMMQWTKYRRRSAEGNDE